MSSQPAIINVEFEPAATKNKNYQITIAPGILADLGSQMAQLQLGQKSNKVLVVSNPKILDYYGDRVLSSLAQAGFAANHFVIPAGERYKTTKWLYKIHDAAYANHLERNSTIVALGGGVIGDMAGFAAATWLRGINFVQVPTSLLAMVDAAIGGKTGVNHPQGKNLIGAFYQPRLVWIDPQVLSTLPSREFRAAIAEVIKYGVIWDAELFEILSQAKRLDQFRYVDANLLDTILYRCAKAKAEVVAKDEKEGGLRAILNYGHTVGHAIEMVTNYRLFNHGEAVALGMIAAGAIAVAMGLWDQESQDRQLELITKAKLPHKLPPNTDLNQIVTALSHDKKVEHGKVRFILPTAIGHTQISDRVSAELVIKVLQQSLTP
ncbi:3-dehydroquinate synthase [Thalassoporum mexicanum]|uniref:3-dehydroquinate synthase n=1 Tax=Thalassoporum mexicanum TaxID=3457544 RepID=UPI0003172DF0|nr:3-dehydroquinate synthase [Pseudanabaena sp. PCC 7367]